MRRVLALIWALAAMWLAVPVEAASSGGGRLIEVERIVVPGLPDQRLTIWLPPGYDRGKHRYPVLYMQDGHNLFDVKKSNFAKIWAADKAMLAVMRRGVRPHIIVGIWAPGADRWRQYLPQDFYRGLTPQMRAVLDPLNNGQPVVSERYADWLAHELKPMIDRTYRTRVGRNDTAIMGSSMGGLISCYTFMRHPGIYGRAACVSTHWPAGDPRQTGEASPELKAAWDNWIKAGLGHPDGRRLWFDHGTATLDAWYAPYQQVVDQRVRALGWKQGRDFESKVYEGAEHEENAWAARLPEILGWLLR